MRGRALRAWVVGLALVGCETQPLVADLDLRRCRPAEGTTGTPGTIAEAVALANGLPFPVTAQCFAEALDRPLRLEASSSRSSVQPAAAVRSPRLFVWGTDALVMTMVIDGEGRDLIEFGQFVTPRRSVKAEIEFPLREPATVAAALQRVRNEEYPRITTCFVCHDRERDEASIPGGRSSLAIRPDPESLVDLAMLTEEHRSCDRSVEPERCRWLDAIVGHGPLERRPFDETLPLF